jgi:hypothetical protein
MVHRANGLVALCDRGFVMNYSFLLMKHVHTHVFEKKRSPGEGEAWPGAATDCRLSCSAKVQEIREITLKPDATYWRATSLTQVEICTFFLEQPLRTRSLRSCHSTHQTRITTLLKPFRQSLCTRFRWDSH